MGTYMIVIVKPRLGLVYLAACYLWPSSLPKATLSGWRPAPLRASVELQDPAHAGRRDFGRRCWTRIDRQ
jgi:hypothetical protein